MDNTAHRREFTAHRVHPKAEEYIILRNGELKPARGSAP